MSGTSVIFHGNELLMDFFAKWSEREARIDRESLSTDVAFGETTDFLYEYLILGLKQKENIGLGHQGHDFSSDASETSEASDAATRGK